MLAVMKSNASQDGSKDSSKRALLAAMGATPALNLPSWAGERWSRQEAENDQRSVSARKAAR